MHFYGKYYILVSIEMNLEKSLKLFNLSSEKIEVISTSS